jgi:hypothetical protein
MTGMNEQDRIRADTLEHLRQAIRDRSQNYGGITVTGITVTVY